MLGEEDPLITISAKDEVLDVGVGEMLSSELELLFKPDE